MMSFVQTTQYLSCKCLDSRCTGTFQMSYEGEMSPRLDIKATVSDLYDAINAMKTLEASRITLETISYDPVIDTSDASTVLCQDTIHRNHSIIFKSHSGNLPSLQLYTAAVHRIDRSVYSTENMTWTMQLFTEDGRNGGVSVCNGLGTCDYSTGTCSCNYVSVVPVVVLYQYSF